MPAAHIYYPNQRIRIQMTFRDVFRGITDPSAITAKVMNPDGIVTQQTFPGDIVRVDVGIYYFEFVVDEGGDWTWWAWSEDPNPESSASGEIKVRHLPKPIMA